MAAMLAVFVGGGAGAVLRHLLSQWLNHERFFWGTFAANVMGSILLAVLFKYGLAQKASPTARLLLTTGFCGGFTTYSTFNLETLGLFEQGQVGKAALYLGATAAACLLGGAAGLWLGAKLA